MVKKKKQIVLFSTTILKKRVKTKKPKRIDINKLTQLLASRREKTARRKARL